MTGRPRATAGTTVTVLLTLLAIFALLGCTADEEKPAAEAPTTATATPTTQAPVPPPAAPAADACYRVSHDEALAPSNTDQPVDCAKGHTSQTYSVGELDLVSNGHLLAVDSEAVREQLSRRCPNQLAGYLGATPQELRLTLLRPVWFTATLEESDLGASWYRCDVIAVTGDSRIAKVTGSLAGALRRPAVRQQYGMCGTDEPGTPAFSHVLCREQHSWKAISVVDLAGASKAGRYPGVKQVRSAGEDDVCAAAAREVASDALDYEWGYEWPTRQQWDAGQTFGRCWAPDPA